MNKVKAVVARKRFFGAVLLVALMAVAIWNFNTQTTSAQTGGGAFGGAILHLVPETPISSIPVVAGTPAFPVGASTFYLQGTAFLNRSVVECGAPAATTKVGTWRMWGVRTGNTVQVPTPTGALGTPNNISAGNVLTVNMSVELEGFNGTLQFQGTLGRAFGGIESAGATTLPFPPIGHPLTDVIGLSAGTGTFRGANGEATITPLILTSTAANCSSGAFELALQESPRFPRFDNVLPQLDLFGKP